MLQALPMNDRFFLIGRLANPTGRISLVSTVIVVNVVSVAVVAALALIKVKDTSAASRCALHSIALRRLSSKPSGEVDSSSL